MLIDGHAYAYRAFHAIRELSAPDGSPTNGIFGFIKAVQKIRTRCQPTHMAVIWDGGLDSQRVEALPAYKAQRPAMPDSLSVQIGELTRWLPAAGIHSICVEGTEADDLIATAALRAEGMEVVIASADKDFMQLVGPHIRLLNPNDKTEVLWGDAQVRTKSGVNPNQIVDWLSLMGDAVDNIPGADHIGPKTAAALLARYDTLDHLLERVDELESERQRASLVAASAQLRLNQQLVRLRSDLPLPVEPQAMRLMQPDTKALCDFYEHKGFRTLLQEAAKARQADLF